MLVSSIRHIGPPLYADERTSASVLWPIHHDTTNRSFTSCCISRKSRTTPGASAVHAWQSVPNYGLCDRSDSGWMTIIFAGPGWITGSTWSGKQLMIGTHSLRSCRHIDGGSSPRKRSDRISTRRTSRAMCLCSATNRRACRMRFLTTSPTLNYGFQSEALCEVSTFRMRLPSRRTRRNGNGEARAIHSPATLAGIFGGYKISPDQDGPAM